jgi:hypothetical protein
MLLLLSGDIHKNPGPTFENQTDSLSVLHQNIRSIRHKMQYIKENFLDFDILCFTETHLNNSVPNDILTIEGYNKIYRKDNNAYSGGYINYVTSKFVSKRKDLLETFLPESLWIEIKNNKLTYLIGTVYRAPNSSVEF